MKLAIMQPYFLPYIGYFQLIAAVDKFILYNHVNYIKRGWMNRNRLLRVNQEPFYISVPLVNASSFRQIYEIRVFNSAQWKRQMLAHIYYNYKRSPYFDLIMPMLENILGKNVDYLYELNWYAIQEICNFLDIKTQIISDQPYFTRLEKYLHSPDSDLNTFFAKEKHLNDRKVIRIIRICEMEGAESFVNPIGGQALYTPHIFSKNGIELSFVQTQPYYYQQHANKFFQHLSIIDVLMNCGKEGTKHLLEKYTLVG